MRPSTPFVLALLAAPALAQAVPFGASCPSQVGTTPNVGLAQFPFAGQPNALQVQGPPNSFGVLVAGVSNQAWGCSASRPAAR